MVFYSDASNLVGAGEDENGLNDVFLHDRVKGTTTLVSQSKSGGSADGNSYSPSLSPNGRFVAFYSGATDLVGHDPNDNTQDIFIYDTKKLTTTRLPLGPGNSGSDDYSYDPVISDNGRWVAFCSAADNLFDGQAASGVDQVFLTDRKDGSTRMMSQKAGTPGNAEAYYPAMSASGKVIVFQSTSSDLVDNDGNGATYDVFRFYPKDGSLRILSLNAALEAGDGGSYLWGAALSGNGKYLAFGSTATNFDSEGAVGNYDTFILKLGK